MAFDKSINRFCFFEDGDVAAIAKLASLTGSGEGAAKGDPSYAKKIYDEMAESFEQKLVDKLGYDAPSRLFQMLQDALQTDNSTFTLVTLIHSFFFSFY